MPNGGSDCCGNCSQNLANEHKFNPDGVHYCKLRRVEITSPFWTYCNNFFYHSWPKNELNNKSEIIGPIFASGIYDGYVRIP